LSSHLQNTGHNPGTANADALAETLTKTWCDDIKTRSQDASWRGHDHIAVMASEIAEALASGTVSLKTLATCIRILRDRNFMSRSARLRAYVGLNETPNPAVALQDAAERLVNACATPDTLTKTLAHPAFAAVFTAHPTFALSDETYAILSQQASDPATLLPTMSTHRRTAPPTLLHELELALAAITRGRDALDILNTEIFRSAARKWSDAHATLQKTLRPGPVILSSWVGFDTDGRTDIVWSDTLKIRLMMKGAQLQRLRSQIAPLLPADAPVLARLDQAIASVSRQHDACPNVRPGHGTPEDVATFAHLLIGERDSAVLTADTLTPYFDAIVSERTPSPETDALLTAISGFQAHGLSLAHIHTRLNAGQIYNVARARLGIGDDPASPTRRRAMIAQINDALDRITPIDIDFGSLLLEQSSAARLMMTMAQIIKHIDAQTPIRFLIAETESGYTLLATLWLSRLLGIPDHMIEISPLFETQSALENGETILTEAFRSRHWRDYLKRCGKLSLQFGYSDSGRYVGQLAATNLVERLRLRTAALLREYDLTDVDVILFDTHGESIGRGAHPFHLADRLKYLSPDRARLAFMQAGITIREESAFQGGDGYTIFGTAALAEATIATIANHVADMPRPGHDHALRLDQVYDAPDFASDFFSTIALTMANLVEDPGYGALLGAFGPSLIDKTGSRPSARQSDAALTIRITHPSQLRAIPNNAILQQLGWWADVLHGLGSAAARHPDTFEQFMSESPRFRRALDFARQALAHSNIEVLRAGTRMLDPGTWLDRAASAEDAETRQSCLSLAHGLEGLAFWTKLPTMFRRIQADHLSLRVAWPEAPHMAPEEQLLHAIRLAIIDRIWMLATRIPYFSPRNNISPDQLMAMILCLDIPAALKKLTEIYPRGSKVRANLDFAEPSGPREDHGFVREHEEIFQPMEDLFALLREIGVAVMHANGAFG